ncbi:MAG: guanylate kinase [Lachnospiraceae bacterium]|nr:guanylate kinase [Lachnospiraceae bacterium]
MTHKGILIVVSGFAGSGKGTLMKALLSNYDNYALSISATTRAPREGEEDGKDYFFVSKEQFEEMIEKGQLLEYASYVSNYYGTPKKYVFDMLKEGKDVILEIETQGALKVKEEYPDTLLMFVMPPSVEEIYNRLKKRGTETEEVIMQRMKRAGEEVNFIEKYDYLVINDVVEDCVRRMHEAITAAHYSADRNMDKIEEVKDQFKGFLKEEK